MPDAVRVPAGVAAVVLAAFVAAVVLAALVVARQGDDKQARKTDETPRGGTLRVGITDAPPDPSSATLDPARIIFSPPIAELYRCCLLRTLVNYRGATTEDGGSVLRPDLAAALPRYPMTG